MPTYNAVKKQIENLRETIAHHEQLYRETLLPVIDDEQFDALVRQLKALEETYPQFAQAQVPASDGFTRRRTIPHRVPMLSLQATTHPEVIAAWMEQASNKLARASGDNFRSTNYLAVAMPKLDGMALSLFYRNGQLVYALTRGRAGTEGHDVTAQAKRLRGIPSTIAEKRDVIVRGEVVVCLEAFRKYQLGDPNLQYSSPRMAAVGALRSADSKLTRLMDACFVAYRRIIFTDQSTMQEAETHLPFHAGLAWLSREAFETVSGRPISRLTGDRDGLDTCLQQYAEDRQSYRYATDGIVFAITDAGAPKIFGQSEHHPHWMMAYKPPAEKANSILRQVEFSVSRSGAVTPIAIVDPVEILNKQVTKINLHSVGFLKSWDLHYGDQIKIGMVHDVVPQFQGAITHGNHPPVAIPTHCPACHAELHATPSGLACINHDRCPAQIVDRFLHFVGPKGMAIRGMGPVIIAALIDQGKLRVFSDLFKLTKDDLKQAVDGSERRAKNLWNAISESRFTSLPRFLIALGISGLGPSLAKPLADFYDYQLTHLLDITDPAQLTASGLVTPGKAKTLIKGFQAVKADVRTMLDLGVCWPVKPLHRGKP